MQDVRDLEGHDEMVRLLSVLSPDEVLQHYKPEERLVGLKPEERLAGLKPEEVLRHYGLDELLRHVRDLSPADRARVESKLPPAVLEVLHRFSDETRGARNRGPRRARVK